MAQIYDDARRLLGNIKLSSDNLDMAECYWLCANRDDLKSLENRSHQIIWGRRGTGKTTLQKAFVYEINEVKKDAKVAAIYIMMAQMVPTSKELDTIATDREGISLYVFSKLIGELCDQLEQFFEERKKKLSKNKEEMFEQAFYALDESIKLYQAQMRGAELTVTHAQSMEVSKESGRETGLSASAKFKLFQPAIMFSRKRNSKKNEQQNITISGKVKFIIETRAIVENLQKMLNALGIEFVYICLDEYCEIDKVSEYSIQSSVAQLIKQVFFKNSLFSVKIATIWNNSRLHNRGGNRVEGIEYQQDAFPGPDLDIMFLKNNSDVISYFKELLVNTYLLGDSVSDDQRQAIREHIEANILGCAGLRHLICGSQGVSRSFVVLVRKYLQEFLSKKNGVVKLGIVYEMIKHQYIEDVKIKVPHYTIYEVIDAFVLKKSCRYFLVSKRDYDRCKMHIKYLGARGVFMQLPEHHTNRSIRSKYKMFVINYGNYIDAIEASSYKTGRKILEEDAKLAGDGLLLPECSSELFEEPEKFRVKIPEGAEKEVYCTRCEQIFINEGTHGKACCTNCGNQMQMFSDFINEVSI